MAIKVNIDNLISDYKKGGGETDFPHFLKKVLEFASEDKNLKSVNHLAYLLATAKVESDYSLERWESDYVCGKIGVKYKDKPCKSAINYYCSTKGGKQNYCDGKPKDKRGLPYFGRGLIQITWKENYKKYGDKIGVNIVDNPEKVFIPENSYNLAIAYLSEKKGSLKKSAFDWVDENDLTRARKSVNGGTKKLNEVNQAFKIWKDLLKKNNAKVVSGNQVKSKSNRKLWLGIGISVLTIGVTGTLIYFYLKKNNKLPNFIKNFNLKK
jgi:predicted chitinase